MAFRIPIRIAVVTIFVLATLTTTGIALGLQYYFSQTLAKSAATNLYTTSANGIGLAYNATLERTDSVIRLLSTNTKLLQTDARDEQLQLFRRTLEYNNALYGLYIGRSDGSFLELINLNHSTDTRSHLLATVSDRWVIVEISSAGSERQRQFTYLDEHWQVRATRSEATDYDVRNRDWYRQALAKPGVYLSAPYLFAHLGAPGQTTSARVLDSGVVVAIDRTLAAVSESLAKQDLPRGSELYIYDEQGGLVASSLRQQDKFASIPVPQLTLSSDEQAFVDSLPALKVSNEMDWPPIDYAVLGEPRGYAVDVIHLIGAMTGLKFNFVNGMTWPSLISEFRDGTLDILQPIGITEQNRNWGEVIDSFMQLPLALVTTRDKAQLRSLAELSGKQIAIPKGWAVASMVRDYFPEITIVETDSPADSLRRVRDGEVFATLDNEPILRYVQSHYYINGLRYHSNLDFGGHPVPDEMSMLVQPGQLQLAHLLNRAIAAIGPEQRQALAAKWLTEDNQQTENIDAGTVPLDLMISAASDQKLQSRLIPAHYRSKQYFTYVEPLLSHESSRWYLGVLVPREAVLAPFNEKVWLSVILTGIMLLLLLPFSWVFAAPIVEPIKHLAVENEKVRRREYDAVVNYPSRIKEIDDLSDSVFNMVQAIQAHEAAQRELMDAFIRLIAQAIDDKSPYTGGHCERVPELALMLAKHASDSQLPAFRDFKLDSQEQWREFRIAAWLHDCGKITTPEHVVDKGSKLETIYNRIHEIRTRFEVLWRDAEISYLKACLADPEAEAEHRKTLVASQRQLVDDFTFVAECNVG
ncbi:transporter substrate-binding domain-containing protein, partial [Parahaliea aestuarii]